LAVRLLPGPAAAAGTTAGTAAATAATSARTRIRQAARVAPFGHSVAERLYGMLRCVAAHACPLWGAAAGSARPGLQCHQVLRQQSLQQLLLSLLGWLLSSALGRGARAERQFARGAPNAGPWGEIMRARRLEGQARPGPAAQSAGRTAKPLLGCWVLLPAQAANGQSAASSKALPALPQDAVNMNGRC
jgi:hypothetical protein